MSEYFFRDLVIDSRTGLNPRKNFVLGNGDNYYVTIKDIHDGQIFFSDKTDRVDDEAIALIKKRSRIKNGDVLFVSIGRIGETAIVRDKDDSWDVNESVFIFTLDTDIIDVEYFCHLMRSRTVQERLQRDSSGSTFKSIKMKQLEKMSFEIPDIENQRVVVRKMSKIAEQIAVCNAIIEKLDFSIKARFVEMFGDPIKNPKGWEVVAIGDVVTEVRYGTSKPAVEGGRYPYLRMNNLTVDGHLDLNDLKYIDISDDEIEKCVVRKGDVLFNRTNSVELVGKTAVFDLPEDMVIAGYIIRVRLNERLLPEVLSEYMNLEALKAILRSMAKGAVNQANINAQELQSIKVYLPDMELQKQFIELKKQIDKSKSVVQSILDKLTILQESMMQEYFG